MKEEKSSKAIPFARPTDDRLLKYRNMVNESLPRFSVKNMESAIEQRKDVEEGNAMYNEGPLQGLPKRM